MRFAWTMIAWLALAAAASAQDVRVKRIAIDVEPYYAASRDAEGTPSVRVHKRYDRLLASNDPADVARARDLIREEWDNVTPMTMMVLAIRLYDTGMRDDAVFWFYAAKNRFVTAMRVADMKDHALRGVEDGMKAFVYLAGPVINGYAFCDIQKQQKIARNALKWSIDHPYTALLDAKVPALPGDRKANIRKSYNEMMDQLAKDESHLASMANVESMRKQRRENGADEKYCWKS